MPQADTQGVLFDQKLEETLVALAISQDELRRWREKGWIFQDEAGTAPLDPVNQGTVDQLTFVRDIVRSGLSDAQIDYLLAQLSEPFYYDPQLISYSFTYGWVESHPEKSTDEVIDDHLDAWLGDLAEADDTVSLSRLRNQIQELIDEVELRTAENSNPLPNSARMSRADSLR